MKTTKVHNRPGQDPYFLGPGGLFFGAQQPDRLPSVGFGEAVRSRPRAVRGNIPARDPQLRQAERCIRTQGSAGQGGGARRAGLRGGGRGQPCSGLRARARVRAASLGANQRAASGAHRPARGPRPRRGQPWQQRLGAPPEPGRGGAEPRGILESAGRWGLWEERFLSSSPRPRPSTGTPNFPVAPPGVLSGGGCWACTCRTGSP